MKYKIAICKIHMIGSPCLILGLCRYDDDDEFWQKLQLFTMEEYLDCQYTYNPSNEWSLFKSQEEADKAAEEMRSCARKLSKYHGEVVHFDSINKDVKVYKDNHSFSLGNAEPVELTKAEVELLNKDLVEWQEFDWETWGK